MLAMWMMDASPPPGQQTQPFQVRKVRERLFEEKEPASQQLAPRQGEIAGNTAIPHHPTNEGTATDQAAPAERAPIYTMATLPQGKSGIYQVMVDGQVLEIAVDVPGEGSPVGMEDLDRTDH